VAPTGKGWLHEIKHDGYRLIVRRDGDQVQIITRGGYDWTHRYPQIVRGALALKTKSFVLDGEGVVCGPDGMADCASIRERTAVALGEGSLLRLQGAVAILLCHRS